MAKVPLMPAGIRRREAPKDATDWAFFAEDIIEILRDPDEERVNVEAHALALADLWNGHVTPLQEVRLRLALAARARKRRFLRRQKAIEKARQRAGTTTADELGWGYRPRLGEGLRLSKP